MVRSLWWVYHGELQQAIMQVSEEAPRWERTYSTRSAEPAHLNYNTGNLGNFEAELSPIRSDPTGSVLIDCTLWNNDRDRIKRFTVSYLVSKVSMPKCQHTGATV